MDEALGGCVSGGYRGRGGRGTNDVWPDTHVSSEGTLGGAESAKDLDAVGNNAQFLVGFAEGCIED